MLRAHGYAEIHAPRLFQGESVTQAIQRRNSDRIQSSFLVHVRLPEARLAIPETICTTANSSREGVYLIGDRNSLQREVRLFLRFPNNFDAGAVLREYLAEVVRLDSLPQGRCGVAARLLHNIRLTLRDGLIVPATGFWESWPPAAPERINLHA